MHMAMGQEPNRTPNEHPNPHSNRLKWVVHLPQNGTIGFDPQPHQIENETHSLAQDLSASSKLKWQPSAAVRLSAHEL